MSVPAVICVLCVNIFFLFLKQDLKLLSSYFSNTLNPSVRLGAHTHDWNDKNLIDAKDTYNVLVAPNCPLTPPGGLLAYDIPNVHST